MFVASSNATDEDVAALQEEVASLRQQVADAEAQRLERERAQHNNVQAARLKAEKEQLLLQLQRAKADATATAARDGVAPIIENARASMDAALAAQKNEQKLAKADEKAAAAASTTGEGS